MSRTAIPTDSYKEVADVLLPDDTDDLGRALGGAVLHRMDQSNSLPVER